VPSAKRFLHELFRSIYHKKLLRATNQRLCICSSLSHFRRPDQGSIIRFPRLPVACEPLRPRELSRRQTRGNTSVSGLRPVAMYSVRACCRQEEPGTGIYILFGRSSITSVHLGEFTLSAGQPLFGSSQQPFPCLGSVAFNGIAIVIHITVVEDAKVKLRRGITAFGGNEEVLYSAALHQNIQTTGRERHRSRTPRTTQCAFSGDCRAVGSESCESLYATVICREHCYMGLK